MERARDPHHALPKAKAPFKQNFSSQTKDNHEKKSLDDNAQGDLRKNKLFSLFKSHGYEATNVLQGRHIVLRYYVMRRRILVL